MGYFSDAYKKSLQTLEEAHTKAALRMRGMTAGNIRERQADLGLRARQGGFAGSGVEEALSRKTEDVYNKRLQDSLSDMQSRYLGTRAGVEMKQGQAEAQEKYDEDIAKQSMFNKGFEGLGELASTLLPLII